MLMRMGSYMWRVLGRSGWCAYTLLAGFTDQAAFAALFLCDLHQLGLYGGQWRRWGGQLQGG
ncbi:hypothetical protein CQ006_15340, partial [Pseudomonas cedrina]